MAPGEGFHPFGGKVSKRFPGKVRFPFSSFLGRDTGEMDFLRGKQWKYKLTRRKWQQLAPDDAYLSCESSE
jgi:hypothetical protein